MQKDFTRIQYGVPVPDDDAYIAEVEDILANEAFQSMAQYMQHGDTTCRQHCIQVSYSSFLACKKLGWHARAAARAGLVHDMFLYDWHDKTVQGVNIHGFTHPRKALQNACREFALTKREKDLVLKHMWPLTIIPPRYKEAYVLMACDRAASLRETALGKIWPLIRAAIGGVRG